MKVITIKQPFASLISEGIKEYEFRTWKTNYRGEILIHAGKVINKSAIEKFSCYDLDLDSGCIIAKGELVDCIKVDDKFREQLKKENPLVYNRVINDLEWNGYAFKIANIKKIDKIYINGKLGLWNYKD